MLRLYLLGTPEIEQGGRLLPRFKNRKAEALIFYLAAMPGQHQRSHLAALLWSELSHEQALNNLRHTLWTIRQSLDEDILDADRLTIGLPPADKLWIDVTEFKRRIKETKVTVDQISLENIGTLQQVADLYRGEFLTEVEVNDAELFDDWLQQQRLAYHKMAVDILTRFAAYYTHYHYLSEAVATIRRLLELEPWQEPAHQQLMSVLALSGQRGAALEHYQEYQSQLLAELGLEPEPETIALVESIRDDQLTRPSISMAQIDSQQTPLPLLGRHTEFAWLIEQWEKSIKTRSQLILVQAEAGIGKTHLVDELCRYVQIRGGLIMSGHASEYGVPLAFQSIAATLRAYIDATIVSKLPLNEMELAELAQLIPELYEYQAHLPQLAISEAGTHRYQLFEAVAHFLQNITTQQPVVMILEGLQWADADTFDILGYLVRRLAQAPLLIIGTYRPGEVLEHHPLLDMRRSLFNEGLVEILRLAELNRESIEQLVQTMMINLNVDMSASTMEQLSDTVWRICQGNPFVAFETLQEMKEQGQLKPDKIQVWSSQEPLLQQADLIPSGVKSRVQRRVARLPFDSQRLLSLAAVIGSPFDLRVLQRASGIPADIILDYLDDWLARRLIKELPSSAESPEQGSYDFDHDLTRAALYHELSLARRQQFHSQIAAALEKLFQRRQGSIIHQLAYHFHHANEHRQALTYLQQAARQAQANYALHAAQSYYDQALQHWDQYYGPTTGGQTNLLLNIWRLRWELLLHQAEVCRHLGQFERHQTALERAAKEMADWGDVQDELRIVEIQMNGLEQQPDLEVRYQLAKKGLTLANTIDDPLTKANLLQSFANCERDLGRTADALVHYEEALSIFSQLNQVRRATFCLISIGSIQLIHDNFDEAAACFDQAMSYTQAEKSPEALTWSYQLMAYIRENLGRM